MLLVILKRPDYRNCLVDKIFQIKEVRGEGQEMAVKLWASLIASYSRWGNGNSSGNLPSCSFNKGFSGMEWRKSLHLGNDSWKSRSIYNHSSSSPTIISSRSSLRNFLHLIVAPTAITTLAWTTGHSSHLQLLLKSGLPLNFQKTAKTIKLLNFLNTWWKFFKREIKSSG